MSCSTCSNNKEGKPGGCRGNGNCGTGTCNLLNSYDWLADVVLPEDQQFTTVEISFGNGSRKEFYQTDGKTFATGDMVVVEAQHGYDIGQLTLQGELVKLRLRKKGINPDESFPKVLRNAGEHDLEKLDQHNKEIPEKLMKARVIARSEGLEMKIGSLESQGDGKKLTVYYTADDRVDFRNLIKLYASEFRVKIEMRQIGSRQEAAKLGGIGSCGRELCCSTWLTDFKSVSTQAARYQQLSINQTKLSGQCGRLKCCLNYELDAYFEAFKAFPKHADKIESQSGKAILLKIDVFKELMYYFTPEKGRYFKIHRDRVREIIEQNKKGVKPETFEELAIAEPEIQEEKYEDLVGQISLATLEKGSKKKKQQARRNRPAQGGHQGRNKKRPPKGKGNQKSGNSM